MCRSGEAVARRPVTGGQEMASRGYVVQQGPTLRWVEGESTPDLKVGPGEKTKRIVLGPVDKAQADRFIDVKVKRAGAVAV